MHRSTIAAVAAVSIIALTQVASAADLPRKAPVYTPPPPPPPVLGWTGFYAGLNAGYHWSNSSVDTVGTPGPFFVPDTFGPSSDLAAQLATTSLNAKNNGFIGGGQIGYNWQFNSWVAGLEADIQGIAHHNGTDSITLQGNLQPTFPDTIVSTTSVEKQVDWLGTVRGRLGFLATPTLLVYGTGGLAYGEVKANTSIAQTATCVYAPLGPCTGGGQTVTYGTTGSFSETRAGWTVGGGLEWMFAPQWSLKGEYLYYDLGEETFALPDLVATVPGHCLGSTCWSAHVESKTRFNGNIARIGVNYHF